MSQDRAAEVSEAEIAVHWQEEDYVKPPEKFVAQANLTDKTVFDRFSLDNFPDCFKEYADLLDWYRTWDVTLDTSNPPFWRWFVGGRINASYNCVDRHLAKYKNKTAIHFVPEPEHEAIQHVTYQELYVRVNEVAALLRDFCGLERGDRVTLHMPMVPELPITIRLRQARRHSLAGLQRLQWQGHGGPYRRFRKRCADHDGRLLSRRPASRSQRESGRRRRRGEKGGREGRESARVGEVPGQVFEPNALG
jgi:hypothetical protein